MIVKRNFDCTWWSARIGGDLLLSWDSREICCRVRYRQYELQGACCWLCGEFMTFGLPQNTYGYVTWEHVIPRCRGGTWDPENLRLSHWECNFVRGSDTYRHRPRPARDEIKIRDCLVAIPDQKIWMHGT